MDAGLDRSERHLDCAGQRELESVRRTIGHVELRLGKLGLERARHLVRLALVLGQERGPDALGLLIRLELELGELAVRGCCKSS